MNLTQRNLFVARLIYLTHIAVIVLYLVGFIAMLGHSRYKSLSASYVASVALIGQLFGGCPLTLAENSLLKQSGSRVSEKTFVTLLLSEKTRLTVSDRYVRLFLLMGV